MAKKFKIKKGDKVTVITGRDKGQTGEVVQMLRGINTVKRHTRASQMSPGGIIEKEAAIHISNIAHIDPKTDKPTRVGYRTDEAGRKLRFARRSGEVIDV
jgi:large subunit ribosomal protein L24